MTTLWFNSYFFQRLATTFARFISITDSTTGSSTSYAVACDSFKNVYIAGTYAGSVSNVYIEDSYGDVLGSLPNGTFAFLVKFNSSGVYQYSRVIQGTGYSVTCDSSDNVYIAGTCSEGTPSVYNELGETLGTFPASIGGTSAFLSKFDSNGAYQYSRLVDAAGSDNGYSVACDASNNVYLAGSYDGSAFIRTASNANVFSNVATLPADLGLTAAFVSKFNSTGVYQYSRIVDGANSELGYSVDCDSAGNLYFAGSSSQGTVYVRTASSANAYSNVGTFPASVGATGTVAFMCKFNSSGAYQYSRLIDSLGSEIGYSVKCDSSDNVYFAGEYNGTPVVRTVTSSNAVSNVATLPADLGNNAAFLAKFNSSGDYQYSRIIDGISASVNDRGQGIAIDSLNNVYLTGSCASAAYVRTASNANVFSNVTTLPTAVGSGSIAVLSKFDSSGTYLYSRFVEASFDDVSYSAFCDADNSVYMTGLYVRQASIKSETSELGYLPYSNVNSVFLVKFDSSGNFNSNSVTRDTRYSVTVDTLATRSTTCYSVNSDSSLNMYTAGNFSNVATIKDHTGDVFGTIANPTLQGAYMSKFNSLGTYVFSRVVDSAGIDYGYSTASDASSNVYFTGHYNGTGAVEDQNGFSFGTLPASSGSGNAFLCKFNSYGAYEYSRVLTTAIGDDIRYGCVCDLNSNVYFVRGYSGTPNVRTQGNTLLATLPTSAGNGSGCLIKFDSAGAYQYARLLYGSAGTGNRNIFDVAVDSLSNVYAVGYYDTTTIVTDQAGTNLSNLPVSAGNNAGVMCKFDSSGNFHFARIVDSTSTDNSLGVTCDSLGNSYMCGQYYGTPTIKNQAGGSLGTLPVSAGTGAAYACKFNSVGTYQYSRIVDSTGDEAGYKVVCDSSNNMYLGGYYTGTPTIKNQSGGSLGTLPASSNRAIFVCKFNSSGTYQYSRIIDTTGTDTGFHLDCDSYDNLFISGQVAGTVTVSIRDQNSRFLGSIPAQTAGTVGFVCKFNSNGDYAPVSPLTFTRIMDALNVDSGQSVACDYVDGVYFAGQYNGSNPTIEDHRGTTLFTLPVGTGNVGIMSKFNSKGKYLYSRIIESTGSDYAYSVTPAYSSNVYLAGFSNGAINIYDQNGSLIDGFSAPAGGYYCYMTLFDSSGAFLDYTKLVDGTGGDYGLCITCDLGSNVYFSGQYNSNASVYDGGGVAILLGTLPSVVGDAGFVCKFSPNTGIVNNLLYSFVIDAAGGDVGQTVACDASNNLYFGGFYNGTARIRRITNNVATFVSNLVASSSDAGFVSKFNSTGAYQYSIVFDSANSDKITGVTCDTSSNLYCVGLFNGTANIFYINSSNASTNLGNLYSTTTAAFMSKFNSTGTYQYSIIVDGAGTDVAYSVACDRFSNVYISGTYSGTPTIYYRNTSNVSTTIKTLPASSNTAVYMCKFDTLGNYVYSRIFDSFGNENSEYNALSCDYDQNVYIAGTYIGRMSVKDDTNTVITTLPATSNGAAFFMKFNNDGSYKP